MTLIRLKLGFPYEMQNGKVISSNPGIFSSQYLLSPDSPSITWTSVQFLITNSLAIPYSATRNWLGENSKIAVSSKSSRRTEFVPGLPTSAILNSFYAFSTRLHFTRQV